MRMIVTTLPVSRALKVARENTLGTTCHREVLERDVLLRNMQRELSEERIIGLDGVNVDDYLLLIGDIGRGQWELQTIQPDLSVGGRGVVQAEGDVGCQRHVGNEGWRLEGSEAEGNGGGDPGIEGAGEGGVGRRDEPERGACHCLCDGRW